MRLITLACVLVTVPLLAQTREAYTLTMGKISPILQEEQECTFPIGTGKLTAYVIVPPESIACVRLRELIGRTGKLVFVPD